MTGDSNSRSPSIVRSSALSRAYIIIFFATCSGVFVWAAISRSPGSTASQWVGHGFFSLAALGSEFMTIRGCSLGRLEITDSELRYFRVRGKRSVELVDVASIGQG